MLTKKLKNKTIIIILITITVLIFLLTISSCTGSDLNLLKDKNLKPYEINLYTFIDQFNNYKKYYINELMIPKISWIEYIENFTSLYGKGKIYKKIIDKRIEKNECAFLVNAKYGKNRCNILLYLVKDNEKWRVFFSKTKLLPQKIKTIKDAEDYRNQKNTEYGLKILSSDIKIDIKDDKFNNVNFNVTYNIFAGNKIKTISFILRSEFKINTIKINGNNISYKVFKLENNFSNNVNPLLKYTIDISNFRKTNSFSDKILSIRFNYNLLPDKYDNKKNPEEMIKMLNNRTNTFKKENFLYITGGPSFPVVPNLIKINSYNCNFNIKTNIIVSVPEKLTVPLINYDTYNDNNYKIYKAYFEHMDLPLFTLLIGNFYEYKYKYNNDYSIYLYFIYNTEYYYNSLNDFRNKVKKLSFEIIKYFEEITGVPPQKINNSLALIFLPDVNNRHIYFYNNLIYFTPKIYNKNEYFKLAGLINFIGTEIGHLYFGKYFKTRNDEIDKFFIETGNVFLNNMFFFKYYTKYCNFDIKNAWNLIKKYHINSIISMDEVQNSDNFKNNKYTFNFFDKGVTFFYVLYVYLGKDTFKKIMQAIEPYSKEGISIREFKIICEKISGKNLDEFFYDFIYSTNIPQNKYVSDDEINNCFLQGL